MPQLTHERRVPSRIPSPREFEAALARHPQVEFPALPGRANHLRSGVLVPLVWTPDPVCIVTVRAATLRQHAGEVCFPGGRPDPGDAGLRETALREAQEELAIVGARVLGALSSVPVYTSDHRLHPFVAEIPETPLHPNPAEVAEVLRVSLREVLERAVVDAIPWEAGDLSGLSPVFELGVHRMFGATAHSFYELLCLAAPLFELDPPPLRPGRWRWSDLLPSG